MYTVQSVRTIGSFHKEKKNTFGRVPSHYCKEPSIDPLHAELMLKELSSRVWKTSLVFCNFPNPILKSKLYGICIVDNRPTSSTTL